MQQRQLYATRSLRAALQHITLGSNSIRKGGTHEPCHSLRRIRG